MKKEKYEYCCDGGSIMIGNKSFRVHVPNEFGDGWHTVQVIDAIPAPDGFNFKCMVDGENFHVYSYDYLHDDDFEDESRILVTLSGKYIVYANCGAIILAKL